MGLPNSSAEIAERLLAGDRAALARLISWAENGHPGFPEALSTLWPKVGRAWRIGITGPPGAGKSTLTNELVAALRASGASVGVLAIDPSSPFTGGALLGDRIRMEERTADEGVYIRSMASREGHGGLARAAADACDVMDAFGFDFILLETVGVGQAEYDVVGAADSVIVVLCPGAGDGIQAMKAGILEVADILVVNKSDLEGADQLQIDLEDALRLRGIRGAAEDAGWEVPVVSISSLRGTGFDVLREVLDKHRTALEKGVNLDRRHQKRALQVRRVVEERLEAQLWGPDGYTERVESSLRKSSTPYDVAQEILTHLNAVGQGTGPVPVTPSDRSR